MVAHTVEERQIAVLHHNIPHTSDHRVEHIERVECDVSQCDSIDSRIIAGTHCPLYIRDGLPEESCRLGNVLALRVSDGDKRKISLRSTELVQDEITAVSQSFGHRTRRKEHRKMIRIVKRNLIRCRNRIINLAGHTVPLHLIHTVGIRLHILIAVGHRHARNSLACSSVCNNAGKVNACGKFGTVDFRTCKRHEFRFVALLRSTSALLTGRKTCENKSRTKNV